MVERFSPQDREKMQVNAKAKDGITALHLAAYCGHVAVVKLLCAWKDVKLDEISNEGLNALHMASERGLEEIVRVLIDACGATQGPDKLTAFVNAQDCLGRTPLHYASRGNHVDVVKKLLVVTGVDPGKPDKVMRLVPLHLAAWMGDHAEVVKLLIKVEVFDHNARVGADKNADIQLEDNQDEEELPRPKLKEALSETKTKTSFTWKESKTWDEEYEIELSIGGGTALPLACQQNRKAVVEALLKHKKVEPNLVDNNGMTPIHYAAAEGHLEVLKVMVSESRVDLNPQVRAPGKYWHERAYRHDTPLHLAVRKGKLDAVIELCANPRLRPNKENWRRRTALHLACITHQAWITHQARITNQDGNPEEIKDVLLARPDVRKYLDEMERDKSSLLNSANGLLVVGTLMAGLSFAATIAPPGGIPLDHLLSFWWFNHLTFFFSLEGFTAAVTCLLPSPFYAKKLFLAEEVDSEKFFLAEEVVYLNRLVIVSTFLIMFAAFSASSAFLAAERAELGESFPEEYARLLGAVLLGVTYNTCWLKVVVPNVYRLFKSIWPDPLGLRAGRAEMRVCKNRSAKKWRILKKAINILIFNILIFYVGFSAVIFVLFFKVYGA